MISNKMKSVECQTDDSLMNEFMAEDKQLQDGTNGDDVFDSVTAGSRRRRKSREPTAGMKKLKQI